jgi:hypothetical protein
MGIIHFISVLGKTLYHSRKLMEIGYKVYNKTCEVLEQVENITEIDLDFPDDEL